MSPPRRPARVLTFQRSSPADRTFIALLGRRMGPHLSARLQTISLADAGLPKSVRKHAEPLAIHTLFDLALAWPWQIDRLTPPAWSRTRLASVLLTALDGQLVPPAAARPAQASKHRQRVGGRLRVHQLKVALRGLRPSIWRRVQVPSAITLRQLHDVIQAAMGWDTKHLHQFAFSRKVYGNTDPQVDPPADLVDDRSVALGALLGRAGSRVHYEYDFGDGWEHDIVVEDIRPAGVAANRALCVDGARACPPEDCGGPMAYQEELLPALADPAHPRHRELLEWLGGPFDPEDFDLAAANRRLARVKLTPA